MRKNTVFSKFLMLITTLTFILIVVTLISILYHNKKNKLYDLHEQTQNLKTQFYYDNLLIDNFIVQDLVDTNFYRDRKSHNIDLHDSLIFSIRRELNNIIANNQINTSVKLIVNDIDNDLEDYAIIVDSIVQFSLLRGFKDFGVIGLMRDKAHELESFDDFEKYKILMLRRHEKDYLIRSQDRYVQLFKDKYSLYKKQVMESSLQNTRKNLIINDLDMYLSYFNEVVRFDILLGIKTNTGLMSNYRNRRLELQSEIATIIDQFDIYIKKSEQNLRLYYYILTFIIILVTFVGGLVIIRYLTLPISNLSKNIKYFVDSNFKESRNFEIRTSIKEISILADNYLTMQKEILILLNDFQQQVNNRTEEIKVQKETIEIQKIEVDKINKNMIDSIKYAKQIQEAMLPTETILSENFDKYFVIFKPRDLVSGDFLWFKRIRNKTFNLKLIAIADCTGHGVPAAMLSMLSIAYLNEIALRKDVVHSNEILEKLRLKFINNFKYDGLDIAFIIIDIDKKTLEYSGANRHIYIKSKSDFVKISGNKMPIGKYPTIKNFDRHYYNYESGDIVFAFTDGITSQLDVYGHTLGTKKIVEILDNTVKFEELENKILQAHYNRNIEDQTDDILLFAGTL